MELTRAATTYDPESEEVIKNRQIIIRTRPDKKTYPVGPTICCRKMKSDVDISFDIVAYSKSLYSIPIHPNIPNHKHVNMMGTPTTPKINSQIVLPIEIFATYTATNAAHAANQRSKKIGYEAAHSLDVWL